MDDSSTFGGGWGPLQLGIAFVLVSVLGLVRRVVQASGAQRTQATVVRWSTGKNRSMFVRLDDGTEARVANAGRELAPVGDRIEVLARPGRRTALRPGAWDLVGPALVGLAAGAALIATGLIVG